MSAVKRYQFVNLFGYLDRQLALFSFEAWQLGLCLQLRGAWPTHARSDLNGVKTFNEHLLGEGLVLLG